MPPTGPRASTARRTASPPPPMIEEHPPFHGPSPGRVIISNQYALEHNIRRLQREHGCDPAREDSYRLQGVLLIESVRHALHLPIKTFTTACTYYHMFRLCHRDLEYNFQDASLACLFVACKVEDTIKKSKEILCAAYNLKNVEHPTTQDDKTFDLPHSVIIGLERHILETIGFDFRARYPQKTLIKVVRRLFPADEARDFLSMAYNMSLDMYKTFAPIKARTSTIVLACIELTALLRNNGLDTVRSIELSTYHTTRNAVVEVMLDLLDLYTQMAKYTIVGMKYELARFIDVKIRLNQEVDAENSTLERFQAWCDKCEDETKVKYPLTPGSATSPATATSWPGNGDHTKKMRSAGQESSQTMRFVYDMEDARREREIVEDYTREDFEEYEVEVEEKIPQPESHRERDRPRHGGSRENGWGPYARDKAGGGWPRRGGHY